MLTALHDTVVQKIYVVAAARMLLALVASMISIRIGLSVALTEMLIGALAGNALHLPNSAQWLTFLAGFGSVLLTFLAGAEIDPQSLRRQWKAAISTGVVSFPVPFDDVWLVVRRPWLWNFCPGEVGGRVRWKGWSG